MEGGRTDGWASERECAIFTAAGGWARSCGWSGMNWGNHTGFQPHSFLAPKTHLELHHVPGNIVLWSKVSRANERVFGDRGETKSFLFTCTKCTQARKPAPSFLRSWKLWNRRWSDRRSELEQPPQIQNLISSIRKNPKPQGGEYKTAHRGNYSQLRIELRQQQRPRLPIPT